LQQWNAKSIASGPKSGIIEIIFLSPWWNSDEEL
jgi:hypothetical protein